MKKFSLGEDNDLFNSYVLERKMSLEISLQPNSQALESVLDPSAYAPNHIFSSFLLFCQILLHSAFWPLHITTFWDSHFGHVLACQSPQIHFYLFLQPLLLFLSAFFYCHPSPFDESKLSSSCLLHYLRQKELGEHKWGNFIALRANRAGLHCGQEQQMFFWNFIAINQLVLNLLRARELSEREMLESLCLCQ